MSENSGHIKYLSNKKKRSEIHKGSTQVVLRRDFLFPELQCEFKTFNLLFLRLAFTLRNHYL